MQTLSPKHERFAQLVAGGSARKVAYRAAGFDVSNDRTAIVNSARLLSRADVRARVAELQELSAREVQLDKAYILRALMKNLSMALGEVATPVSRVNRKTGRVETVEVAQYDGTAANRAAELLGKELSMFTDRHEIGGPGDFSRLSDDELRAKVREIYKAAGVRVIDDACGQAPLLRVAQDGS
jgi:phage terminase small subunit